MGNILQNLIKKSTNFRLLRRFFLREQVKCMQSRWAKLTLLKPMEPKTPLINLSPARNFMKIALDFCTFSPGMNSSNGTTAKRLAKGKMDCTGAFSLHYDTKDAGRLH